MGDRVESGVDKEVLVTTRTIPAHKASLKKPLTPQRPHLYHDTMATKRDAARNAPSLSRSKTLALAAIVLATLVACLAWSNAKIFWGDEMLEFYSDIKPPAAILHDQLRNPFSLEPPTYHLLLHGMHSLLPGYPEIASRLPSIVALLVTEIAIFFLTWSLTRRSTTAVFSAVLPFVLVTIDYGPEARVYSLLTACFAIALLSYRYATASDRSYRSHALIALALSIGAGNLLHYYALFSALPILVAEAWRTATRRRADWPLLAALAVGLICFAADLPFLHALSEFSKHYYYSYETRWGMILLTYLWYVLHFGIYFVDRFFSRPVLALHILFILAALIVLATAYTVLRRVAITKDNDRSPVLLALLVGFLLPAWDVFIAHFVTRAYQPRYTLPACVAIAVLASLLANRWHRFLPVATFFVGLTGCIYVVHQLHKARALSEVTLSDTALTPSLVAAFAAQPDHHLYLQNTARFLVSYAYAPPQIQHAMVLTYDQDKELAFRNRDSSSLFARNMMRTTPLPIRPFQAVLAQPGTHLFAVYHEVAEEWIGLELASPRYHAKIIGHAFGADLVQVSLAPAPLSR